MDAINKLLKFGFGLVQIQANSRTFPNSNATRDGNRSDRLAPVAGSVRSKFLD